MWHIDILQYLAKKVCKSNQNMAARFIAHFIHLAEEQMNYELMAILGFIKDLYLFVEQNKNRDAPLSEFARKCLGLFILHAKNADDYMIYASDFIPLLKDKIIFSGLGIQKEVIQLNEYFFKKAQLRKISPSLFSRDPQKLVSVTPNKVFVRVVLQIEKEVFFSLDHKVSLSVDELNTIFPVLLSEINEPYQVVTELLYLLKEFKHPEEQFAQFILELEKIQDKLLPPTLNEICLQLEEYVKNAIPYLYSHFFYSSDHHYVEEVSEIIEQIKQKELNDVDVILNKLYEIDIATPKDPLTDIIQSLEAQYRSIIFEV